MNERQKMVVFTLMTKRVVLSQWAVSLLHALVLWPLSAACVSHQGELYYIKKACGFFSPNELMQGFSTGGPWGSSMLISLPLNFFHFNTFPDYS